LRKGLVDNYLLWLIHPWTSANFEGYFHPWISFLEKRRDITLPSSKWGKLHLPKGLRSLPFLASRSKNYPISMPSDLQMMFKFTVILIHVLLWWGTFPKCRVRLDHWLILGPLFWECLEVEALPYTPKKTLSIRHSCKK